LFNPIDASGTFGIWDWKFPFLLGYVFGLFDDVKGRHLHVLDVPGHGDLNVLGIAELLEEHLVIV
jgi:hypothetical protein